MISIASLNCNGLVTKNRRDELFTYCIREKFDIVLLQETFWDKSVHQKAAKEWPGQIFSSFYNIDRSKGVSVLIRRDSDIEVLNDICHVDGRTLQIDCAIDDQVISIVNVYSPHLASERKAFFIDLYQILSCISNPCILAGDFNTVINSKLDRYPGVPRPDPSRKYLVKIMNDFNLLDVWREQNPPPKIAFTRTGNATTGRTASRIDRFLISKSLLPNTSRSSIIPYPKSDHNIIVTYFNLSLIPRGKGIWILNNSLLKDESFCLVVRELIENLKTESDYENDILRWYDRLKDAIKNSAIKYGTHRQRVLRATKKRLQKEISYENIKANKYPDYDTTRLKLLEDELTDIIANEIEGALIRSKVKWIEEGEKSTKFFFNLEKSRQKKKVMRQILKDNGELITDQKSIMKEQVSFYRSLYRKEGVTTENISLLTMYISKKLSPSERDSCDQSITEEELLQAVKAMESSKSPGLDGLTVEFYRAFWPEMSVILSKLISEIFQAGELTESMKGSVITLIPKKGDLRRLTNWRPISLLNVDYKLIAKVLANRVSNVISTLVSEDQSCCVPGRDIAHNVLLIKNIIDFMLVNNMSGLILKIDQFKAFDRVDHAYLSDVLLKMGFGENFRRWVEILYNDIHGCVKHNGNVSGKFSIERGVRQGCPLSASLYVLTAEPLHEVICNCKVISGISFLDLEAKMFQHADDTTFITSNPDCLTDIFRIIKLYEKGSGSKCNLEKTELLTIGNTKVPSNLNFPVRDDFIQILGVIIGNNPQVVEKENWGKKTEACCSVLAKWKGRNLSFKGKALVINSLAISRLVYLASILHVPHWVSDMVRNSINDFVWQGKKPLISSATLALPFERGGLNLCNLDLKKEALRVKFIALLLRNGIGCKLKRLMLYFLNHYENMKLGLNIFRISPQTPSLRCIPPYFSEMLHAWRKISMDKLCPPGDRTEILSQPIFHNPFIRDYSGNVLLNRDFIDGGIIYVNDIMYEILPRSLPAEGVLESIQLANPRVDTDIQSVSNVLQTILDSLPDGWLDIIFASDKVVNDHDDDIPNINFIIDDKKCVVSSLTTKGATVLLRECNTNPPKGETFWSAKFTDLDLSKRWSNVYKGLNTNYEADLNFKILHNILFTNERLYKFGMIESPLCTLCGTETESLFHLFIACPVVNSLWCKVIMKLRSHLEEDNLNTWVLITLFGMHLSHSSKKRLLVDFIFTIYKSVIYKARLSVLIDNLTLSIDTYFFNSLKKKIETLYHCFNSKGNLSKFWSIFQGAKVIEFDQTSKTNYRFIFDTG
ncbi:hypothetical protein HOLleu_30774 [Holothuria leucospilota]|uniref:Reverse transcriptase domain-containing protein n=1 Tax=Holothuria leucospilota TaxID=206669 RepID=A0A9Q1H1F2_HOLLE|nr:hypothetical protein HOLleu_30774 [Holothuria leucospilota]